MLKFEHSSRVFARREKLKLNGNFLIRLSCRDSLHKKMVRFVSVGSMKGVLGFLRGL